MHYTLNDHPLHQAIYDLCQEIEKLPPSEHATKLVVMAGALQQPVAQLRADLDAALEDTARLDWLEGVALEGGFQCTGIEDSDLFDFEFSNHENETAESIRAAIDSARAGEAGK